MVSTEYHHPTAVWRLKAKAKRKTWSYSSVPLGIYALLYLFIRLCTNILLLHLKSRIAEHLPAISSKL